MKPEFKEKILYYLNSYEKELSKAEKNSKDISEKLKLADKALESSKGKVKELRSNLIKSMDEVQQVRTRLEK